MKRVETRYSAIGCVPGCKHRGPDVEKLGIWETRRTREQYEVLTITPGCDRAAEVGKRREGIYRRAYAVGQAAMEEYKSLRGKLKARRRAWDIVTAEWKEQPCPFAEVPQ